MNILMMICKWMFLFFSCFVYIDSNAQAKVVARVTGLKNDKGLCRACLFNSASSFGGFYLIYKNMGTPAERVAV